MHNKLERAKNHIRIYPSDFKKLHKLAAERRTIIAQIVHEALLSDTTRQ